MTVLCHRDPESLGGLTNLSWLAGRMCSCAIAIVDECCFHVVKKEAPLDSEQLVKSLESLLCGVSSLQLRSQTCLTVLHKLQSDPMCPTVIRYIFIYTQRYSGTGEISDSGFKLVATGTGPLKSPSLLSH